MEAKKDTKEEELQEAETECVYTITWEVWDMGGIDPADITPYEEEIAFKPVYDENKKLHWISGG